MSQRRMTILTLLYPALTLSSCSLLERASARACMSSAPDTSNWHREYTADSTISIRLPNAYRADSILHWGDYTSWFWHTDRPGALQNRFDRQVTITTFRNAPGTPPQSSRWLSKSDAARSNSSDPEWVEARSSCTDTIGGGVALVEAGLVSGGALGIERLPSVHASWETRRDSVAVFFQGEASDRVGQEEIIAILRTTHFRMSIR